MAESLNIAVIPLAESALEDFTYSYKAAYELRVRSHKVIAMLPVVHQRLWPIVNMPAAPTDQHIEPPVMGNDRLFGGGVGQQLPGAQVEQHGVAPRNTLHYGIIEAGGFVE